MARHLKERREAQLLTAHGTLYKALDRLRGQGFLESEWEDASIAAEEGRPRRRFYFMTADGEAALERARQGAPAVGERRRGLAST